MTTLFSRALLLGALLLTGAAASTPAAAQTATAATRSYDYLQMTTIESVVAGGFGRSKLSFTPAYKGAKEGVLENLFSLTGLNLGNVQKNEETIQRSIQMLSDDGYDLYQVVPLTSSIQGGGIFMTRYLFRKAR